MNRATDQELVPDDGLLVWDRNNDGRIKEHLQKHPGRHAGGNRHPVGI